MQPWLPSFTQPHELGMDWAKNCSPEGLKAGGQEQGCAGGIGPLPSWL